MFQIPELKSTKTLFVINKDFYVRKETGEMRVTIEVLVPAGGSRPNKKGYAVAGFSAEQEVYEAINLDRGPVMVTFETEPRESRNNFGGTTNTDHLLSVVSVHNQKPAQTNQQQAQATQAPKAN